MNSPKTVSVTPQEGRLLRAFRQVHREDCALLVDLVEIYAENHPASKPRLRLVSNEKRRATDTKASA